MKLMTVKCTAGINLIAVAATFCFFSQPAEGARLHFKNGDYIDGRRVYGKRGNVFLEVVKGTGGTIVFGRDEVDLERTFAAAAKPSQQKESHRDELHNVVERPIVFSDAGTHGGDQHAVAPQPDVKEHDSASSQATVKSRSVSSQQVDSQGDRLTLQIPGSSQVGYVRTVTEQEKGLLAKSQDSTRYYGRIEKDGTATFTNNEGSTLRGYIGENGVGSVMDENQNMISIEPRH